MGDEMTFVLIPFLALGQTLMFLVIVVALICGLLGYGLWWLWRRFVHEDSLK